MKIRDSLNPKNQVSDKTGYKDVDPVPRHLTFWTNFRKLHLHSTKNMLVLGVFIILAIFGIFLLIKPSLNHLPIHTHPSTNSKYQRSDKPVWNPLLLKNYRIRVNFLDLEEVLYKSGPTLIEDIETLWLRVTYLDRSLSENSIFKSLTP